MVKYLNVKITIFWNMTPYILVMCYRRFRRACCVFAINSIQLQLSPVLPNLCSWSSTVEWPTIAPWPYIFVVNRRWRGTLIRNNVQQHDLSAVNKTDFNITADLWDGKVFLDFSVLFPQLYGKYQGITSKDGARPVLSQLVTWSFYVLFLSIVLFYILFVCKCVL